MIESIEFTNFKSLRKTTLSLAPFTLLLGPNGSGKSTVLKALELMAADCAKKPNWDWKSVRSVHSEGNGSLVKLRVRVRLQNGAFVLEFTEPTESATRRPGPSSPTPDLPARDWLKGIRIFNLNASAIA